MPSLGVRSLCAQRTEQRDLQKILDMGLTLMIFFISRIVKAQSWAILAAVRENFFYFAKGAFTLTYFFRKVGQAASDFTK